MKKRYVNKKYRILETLNTKFSKDQAKIKKLEIMDKIPVSNRTFQNWLYLNQADTTEISYSNLKKIAIILNVQVDALINFEINV